MQQPIGQAGRVRLSPLMSAVASSKSSATAGGGLVDAVNGSTNANTVSSAVLPDGVDPEAVKLAQQQAAQGDQASIDWLKAVGITVGVAAAAGGAYAVKRALSNRNKKTLPPNFGAEDVAVKARSPNVATTTSKAIPHVTPLRDEMLIPHSEELPMQAPATALRKAAAAVRRLR